MRVLFFLLLPLCFMACKNETSSSTTKISETDNALPSSTNAGTPQTSASKDKEAEETGPEITPKDVMLHGGSSKKWYISAVNAYSGGNLGNLNKAVTSEKESEKPSITFDNNYKFVLDSGSDLMINFNWNNIPIATNRLEGSWEVDLPKQFLRFILVLEDKEQGRRGRLTMNCPYASLSEQLVEADINLQFLGDHFQFFTGSFELVPAN